MSLEGKMTVSVKKEGSKSTFNEEVLGSEFGEEENYTRNLGDGDTIDNYIYKYFGDGYEAIVNFSILFGQVDSFEGPYITNEDDDTEANIIESSINVA